MHTESDIRKIAKELLEKYGRLTTSEVIHLIEKSIVFDTEDLKPLKERKSSRFPNGEPRIYQIIRNVAVRCTPGEIKIYPEGFLISKKAAKKTFWEPTIGLTNKEKPLDNEIITKKRDTFKKERASKKSSIIKIDWSAVNEKNTDLGARGEEFVFQKEIEKVKTFSPESIDKVIHSSFAIGDGLGYDILSINNKGETIYIEVKTTKGSLETPFYMSINEKNFLTTNKNSFLARVYNFDLAARHGLIKMYSGAKLLDIFNFDPISYKVTKK